MQGRSPAKGPRARAANPLVERERIRVRTELVSRLLERHVPDIGAYGQMWTNGLDDVIDALVAFVVRVEHPGGVRALHEPHVEIGEIAVVDERPVVVAVADDANQPIGRGLEQLAHDPFATAVHDPRTYDHRAKAGRRGIEDSRLVSWTPGHHGDGIDGHIFGGWLGASSEYPHPRCVNQE